MLFASSRGMISSRQIERACSENILHMALSGGYQDLPTPVCCTRSNASLVSGAKGALLNINN
jgi:hypothetical protein